MQRIIESELFKRWLAIGYPKVRKWLSVRGIGRGIGYVTNTYKYVEPEHDHTGDESEYKEIKSDLLDLDDVTETSRYIDVWPRVRTEMEANFKPAHQGRIGTCAMWTVQNLINQALYNRGLTNSIEACISLLYRNYRFRPGNGEDSGTATGVMLNRLKSDGVPLRTIDPIKDRKNLLTLDRNKTVESGEAFRLDILGSVVREGASIEQLARDLEALNPREHVVQHSLDIFRHKNKSKSFWNNLIIKWHEGMYKTGRHSLVQVFTDEVSVVNDKGERGFIAVDSGDGYLKFIKESYLKKASWNYRIVRLKEQFREVQELEKKDPLESEVISYGQKGESVRVLQSYLLSKGFGNFRPTGYFGKMTASALSQWQIQNLGRDYGGRLWSRLSQDAYSRMKKQ